MEISLTHDFFLILFLVEKEVLITDVKTCDGYLLLAVHIIMEVYDETKDDIHLLLALSWLEQGALISPAAHQISLMLIHIYTSIG